MKKYKKNLCRKSIFRENKISSKPLNIKVLSLSIVAYWI